MKLHIGFSIVAISTGLIGGCGLEPYHHNPTTRDVTEIDETHADVDYWMNQPAKASVQGDSFDTLWNAADAVSRDLLFKIDRRDRRNGILTTEPNVSSQWFEPWRQELQTSDDVARSSVATISRSIQFAFTKTDKGFTVTPKVLVERQSLAEKRISGTLSKGYFRSAPAGRGPTGSRELDEGVILPQSYWYPIGRDELLEAKIAELIQSKIKAG